MTMENVPAPSSPSSFNWRLTAIILAVILAIVLLAKVGMVNSHKRSELNGKWVCRETVVPTPGVFDKKGEAIVVERQAILNADGSSSYVLTENGKLAASYPSNWTIAGDYLVVSYQTQGERGLPNRDCFHAFRVLRLSKERLVLVYADGVERIFDRVQ